MTDKEMAAVQLALDRGQLLYAYDRAAWQATDAMLLKAKSEGIYERVMSTGGGYVIEGDTSQQVVTFFDRSEPPLVLYRATLTGSARSVALVRPSASDANTMNPNQQRLVSLRKSVADATSAGRLGFCVRAAPNLTLLPPTGASRAEVAYVMTPQTDLRSWPMGRHYRFDLLEGKPGKARPFSKSCISIGAPDGTTDKPAAMVITHILDDTPTEIHVFTMLASRLPLFVMTARNKKIWAVESVDGKARIRLVDDAVAAFEPKTRR